MKFWVQLWNVCSGLILGHSQVPIDLVWSESDGSPFLIVGVVSQGWRAILHSFAPGLQTKQLNLPHGHAAKGQVGDYVFMIDIFVAINEK